MLLRLGRKDNRLFQAHRPRHEDWPLSDGDLRDLHVLIRMVPLQGDAFESQAKRFALAGSEWRKVEVNGFVVRSGGAEDAQRSCFALCGLSHVVFESYLHDGVDDSLVAGVGHGTVQIADGSAHKILCRAGFQV